MTLSDVERRVSRGPFSDGSPEPKTTKFGMVTITHEQGGGEFPGVSRVSIRGKRISIRKIFRLTPIHARTCTVSETATKVYTVIRV